jgi:hypothetical protein
LDYLVFGNQLGVKSFKKCHFLANNSKNEYICSVKKLLHYATELEDKMPEQWPGD